MEIAGLDGSSVNSCEIPSEGPGLLWVVLYFHVQCVTVLVLLHLPLLCTAPENTEELLPSSFPLWWCFKQCQL